MLLKTGVCETSVVSRNALYLKHLSGFRYAPAVMSGTMPSPVKYVPAVPSGPTKENVAPEHDELTGAATATWNLTVV